MRGSNPRDSSTLDAIVSLEQLFILALTDFMYEIIPCIFFSTYCFILIVVGKCEAPNAESINEYFCFSVKLSSKHSRKIFGYTDREKLGEVEIEFESVGILQGVSGIVLFLLNPYSDEKLLWERMFI